MNTFKSGFVSIIGRPNVGKSTLLNHLIGEKISIISNKPQTTRNNILGILTEDNYQIVFTDTPGIHIPKNKLGEYMMQSAKEAVCDIDAVLFLVEPYEKIGKTEQSILADLKKSGVPAILIINKIDAVRKDTLLSVISAYANEFDFSAVIPISALKNDGIDTIKKELMKYLNDGPMFYPEDMITDQPERQVVSEIIREKMLRRLDKEVPHGVAIEIVKMSEKENITEIQATIYCEKASHKGIIIGKGGESLKQISSLAREDIEKMLDKKVFLEVWVKVKEDWRNKGGLIKNFGYE